MQIFLKWSCACKPHAHVRMSMLMELSCAQGGNECPMSMLMEASWEHPWTEKYFEILNSHNLLSVKFNRWNKLQIDFSQAKEGFALGH